MFPIKTTFAKEKANKREIGRHTKKGDIKFKRIFKKMAVRNPDKSLHLCVCSKMSCPLAKLCLMGVYLASS